MGRRDHHHGRLRRPLPDHGRGADRRYVRHGDGPLGSSAPWPVSCPACSSPGRPPCARPPAVDPAEALGPGGEWLFRSPWSGCSPISGASWQACGRRRPYSAGPSSAWKAARRERPPRPRGGPGAARRPAAAPISRQRSGDPLREAPPAPGRHAGGRSRCGAPSSTSARRWPGCWAAWPLGWRPRSVPAAARRPPGARPRVAGPGPGAGGGRGRPGGP